MTVSDMEIYEPQRQYLESLGLLSCSVIYYEQLCDSFIVAVESVFSDATEEDEDGNELDFTEDTIFISEDPEGYQYGWSFFIPESCLLPKEEQVRPFTSEEWKHKFEIGTVLKLREKETKDFSKLMYLGYDITNLGLEALIGNTFYSLEKLSEFYEYYDEESHKWVPFGVVM